MGEIPIFTSKAHVFIIDQVSKRSWIPASKSAVLVNFFFDSSRNSFRVISVEESKAIINSTLLPEMSFIKTSAKFGQWVDIQAGTVYGLGFASESSLNRFSEQFENIRERAKLLLEQGIVSRTSEASKSGCAHHSQRAVLNHDADDILSSNSDESQSTAHGLPDLKSLKLDNDKLKIALSQSSTTTRKLELEIHSLKMTNKQVINTLQESLSNANQLHGELMACTEDNEKLKIKIADLESENSKGIDTRQKNTDLRKTIEQLRNENAEKCKECITLQQRIGVLNVIEKQHTECAARIKKSNEENYLLKEKISALENDLKDLIEERNKVKMEIKQYLKQVSEHACSLTQISEMLQTAV
ncbi:unnamed protein product [Clavelina lepadiformis]|uniref:WH1 domain-containing protein n=1 Tax=Clavelina lepadiformis TaxID=159417 RepID=A0ABP0GHP3_CLALP